jgi:hypothetical protein
LQKHREKIKDLEKLNKKERKKKKKLTGEEKEEEQYYINSLKNLLEIELSSVEK